MVIVAGAAARYGISYCVADSTRTLITATSAIICHSNPVCAQLITGDCRNLSLKAPQSVSYCKQYVVSSNCDAIAYIALTHLIRYTCVTAIRFGATIAGSCRVMTHRKPHPNELRSKRICYCVKCDTIQYREWLPGVCYRNGCHGMLFRIRHDNQRVRDTVVKMRHNRGSVSQISHAPVNPQLALVSRQASNSGLQNVTLAIRVQLSHDTGHVGPNR